MPAADRSVATYLTNASRHPSFMAVELDGLTHPTRPSHEDVGAMQHARCKNSCSRHRDMSWPWLSAGRKRKTWRNFLLLLAAVGRADSWTVDSGHPRQSDYTLFPSFHVASRAQSSQMARATDTAASYVQLSVDPASAFFAKQTQLMGQSVNSKCQAVRER